MKEAIYIRLPPNKWGSRIEIFEAWTPTIKKENSQSITRRTYEGATLTSLTRTSRSKYLSVSIVRPMQKTLHFPFFFLEVYFFPIFLRKDVLFLSFFINQITFICHFYWVLRRYLCIARKLKILERSDRLKRRRTDIVRETFQHSSCRLDRLLGEK